MMIDTFNIEEKDGKLHVYIEIPRQNLATKVPKFALETKDVIAELEKREVEFGEYIEGKRLKNWREYSRKGTWIFEKKKVDKSPKQVILKEEKSVKPKTKPVAVKKKRTRSSVKKVSKEV